jgi:hypothetical protein
MTEEQASPPRVELPFILTVEDGWPPVGIEVLPCTRIAECYRVEVPPLFVKNLSKGDLIAVSLTEHGQVSSWRHVRRSGHTTIWLLRLAACDLIDPVLEQLRALDCFTVRLPEYGSYSVDVPPERAIEDVEACLAQLDSERVAVAYPSFRHDGG